MKLLRLKCACSTRLCKTEYDRSLKTATAQRNVADIVPPLPVADDVRAKVFSHSPAEFVPPPYATSDVRAKAFSHVAASIVPPPVAAKQVSAPPLKHVPTVVAVRHRLVNRKRRPSWGPAIAICLVGAAVSGTAIKLLMDAREPIVTSKPIVPPTVPPDPDPAPPPKPQKQKEKPPVPPVGKLPVPTPEQLKKAKDSIRINGRLTPVELLDAAKECEHPSMRYVLYQMTIDAAVAEANSEIALRAAEAIIEQYEVDADALRNEVQKKLQPRIPPPAIDAPHPPAFHAVRLRSGKEVTEDDLKPVSPTEIRAMFPAGSSIFVLESETIMDASRTVHL